MVRVDRHEKGTLHGTSGSMSSVIRAVVDGLLDSLRSTGEGVLPIVLILRPELSTRGIAETDAEFANRGRRQSAAETQFFRKVEPALRQALTRILTRAAQAPTNGGAR